MPNLTTRARFELIVIGSGHSVPSQVRVLSSTLPVSARLLSSLSAGLLAGLCWRRTIGWWGNQGLRRRR